MASIFIHPGTHKTATTTIQAILERKAGAAVDLSTPAKYRKSAFDIAWRRGTPGTHADLFLREFVTTDVAVISEERLLGQPTGQDMLFARHRAFQALTAELTELGHDVRVLLTLRNPFDFLKSWHLQILFSGASNDSFLSFLDNCQVTDFSYSNLLADVSGKAAVKIVPFELLQFDRAAFVAGLNDWLQMDLFAEDDFDAVMNPSLGEASYQIMRSVSLADRKDAAKLGQLLKDHYPVDGSFSVLKEPTEMLLRTALTQINADFIANHIHDPRVKQHWLSV